MRMPRRDGGQVPTLLIRAFKQDRRWARRLVAALIAEGVGARLTLKPVSETAPVLFLCTAANAKNLQFASEVRDCLSRAPIVIAADLALSNSFLRKLAHHATTVSLASWDGYDRAQADFRDLVSACRRIAAPDKTLPAPLSLKELMGLRGVAAATTEVAKEDVRHVLEGDPGSARMFAASRHDDAAVAFRRPSLLAAGKGPLLSIRGPRVARPNQVRQPTLPGRAAGTKTPSGRPANELVEASAFAPLAARSGGQLLVQVFLHTLAEFAAAAALARKADPNARRRGIMTLATEIARGQRVDIFIEAPGLAVDTPAQNLIWQGQPRACQFLLRLSRKIAAGPRVVTARLAVDGVPLGTLRFTLEISRTEVSTAMTMRGDGARRYRYAFLSYAAADRREVLKRADQLKAAGIDFFQDILCLKPGEVWPDRLYQEIDRCDVFFLYWSSHAARSKWVMREVKHALRCQKLSGQQLPDITPIILEGPPVPPPPATLKKLHFNSAMRYMIVATETEQLRRSAS